jgi:SNF2 family DNA or RNA helicase
VVLTLPVLSRQKLKDIARVLQNAGAFGPDCRLQQVVTELTRMSDFDIHRYAVALGSGDGLLFPGLSSGCRCHGTGGVRNTKACFPTWKSTCCQRTCCSIRVRMLRCILPLKCCDCAHRRFAGKLNYLKDLIPSLVADGHRILLFSQWTTVWPLP